MAARRRLGANSFTITTHQGHGRAQPKPDEKAHGHQHVEIVGGWHNRQQSRRDGRHLRHGERQQRDIDDGRHRHQLAAVTVGQRSDDEGANGNPEHAGGEHSAQRTPCETPIGTHRRGHIGNGLIVDAI
jgi:hypothetical protein